MGKLSTLYTLRTSNLSAKGKHNIITNNHPNYGIYVDQLVVAPYILIRDIC